MLAGGLHAINSWSRGFDQATGFNPDPSQLHHAGTIIESKRQDDGSITNVYAPGIILSANRRIKAQQALNLIVAAYSLRQIETLSSTGMSNLSLSLKTISISKILRDMALALGGKA
jgi:hypothetical protein